MINENDISSYDFDRLKVLSEIFPNISAVYKEIINLKAIMNLPKGTEHFISDIHGEYDTFYHILNNCSGVIKEKALEVFGGKLSPKEIDEFCTLIYYPDEKLKLMGAGRAISGERYKVLLKQLTEFAVHIAYKYTRSKVRKALPRDYSYIIDELMHARKDEFFSQMQYHEHIYQAIIDTGAASQIVISMVKMIKRLAVDRLHIVGDIFDRGKRADKIINTLLTHHSLDIQWGNHDILWMGAAAGNAANVAAIIYLSLKYDSYQILENGYGISLRRLVMFAEREYPSSNEQQSALRAISAIMFKLEGQLLSRHPEYGMQDRLLLDKINYDNYTISLGGKLHKINKADLPTVNPKSPYELTEEENEIISDLLADINESEMLKLHIEFLYSKGSMFTVFNDNLLFHGCVPMDESGNFASVNIGGIDYKGKALLEKCDRIVRNAYYQRDLKSVDFMWYLWGGIDSPVSGRLIKTFERTYIKDKSIWEEPMNSYFDLIGREETANAVLAEFNLTHPKSRIINGHTPVHAITGESPIKANGKVIVIDGGFCKAYHGKTGTAGYTLIYNSKGLRIMAHRPFSGIEHAVTSNLDILSDLGFKEKYDSIVYVKDTDNGQSIFKRIVDLEKLLVCYKSGTIPQM